MRRQDGRRASPRQLVRLRAMSVLVFVLAWVLLGLGVVLVGMSGGPGGAASRLQSQTRRGRRAAIGLFALAVVVLGIGVPAAVIAAVDDRTDIPQAGVSNLTAAEKHGQQLFGERCAACHTLKAANAIATVGPNLDQLHPPKALILNAIANGRARGNGNMPAQIYTGRDAQDVASFVARVAGAGA
jgi:mono/diheme cytochrome c family protein